MNDESILTSLALLFVVAVTIIFHNEIWAGMLWVMDTTDAFNRR